MKIHLKIKDKFSSLETTANQKALDEKKNIQLEFWGNTICGDRSNRWGEPKAMIYKERHVEAAINHGE